LLASDTIFLICLFKKSLALAALGWDVIATDIRPVVNTVLRSNATRNLRVLRESRPPSTVGDVQVRELDWTVVPQKWRWDDPHLSVPASHEGHEPLAAPINPRFDLIVTSDTLYSAELVEPLLRTMKHLCTLSTGGKGNSSIEVEDCSPRIPLRTRATVYLALENRDPALVTSFFEAATQVWGFSAIRIPSKRVSRAMQHSRLDWDRSEWEGVEVWKLQLKDSPTDGTPSKDTIDIANDCNQL